MGNFEIPVAYISTYMYIFGIYNLYHICHFLYADMRSTLSPMFTGSKMRMMFDYVATIGNQTASTIKSKITAGGENVFEFKDLASKFTVDVIASCAFGIEVNSFKDPENDFYKIASTITNFANLKTALKFIGYLAIPSFMKAFGITMFGKKLEIFFQEAVHDMMKYREEQGIVRNDMINLLIQAKKGNLSHDTTEDQKVTESFATVEESQLGKSQVKTIWDDDDLAAQCFIFFFAGFEPVRFLKLSNKS